jgi:hypothetical protein
MEGRHVGLDFYDLLIEAIEKAAEVTKRSELSMGTGSKGLSDQRRGGSSIAKF